MFVESMTVIGSTISQHVPLACIAWLPNFMLKMISTTARVLRPRDTLLLNSGFIVVFLLCQPVLMLEMILKLGVANMYGRGLQ